MRYLMTTVVLMVVTFFGASVALAQTNAELVDLARPVLDAVMSGSYMYAAALGLVLAVALLRRFGGARWPTIADKRIAPFWVLLGSFGAALATALAGGVALSGGITWAAVQTAVVSAGGYALLKPIIMGLESRAPSWLKPLLGLITWVFSARGRAEKARAAGVAAVAANPAQGADVGFRDVP